MEFFWSVCIVSQLMERIRVNGVDALMRGAPLNERVRDFLSGRIGQRFVAFGGGSRVYVGSWEIDGERLWLVSAALYGVLLFDLVAHPGVRLPDGVEHLSLPRFRGLMREMFPGHDGRVLADWYTGSILVEYGQELEDSRLSMYGPEREFGQIIDIDRGRVVSVRPRESK